MKGKGTCFFFKGDTLTPDFISDFKAPTMNQNHNNANKKQKMLQKRKDIRGRKGTASEDLVADLDEEALAHVGHVGDGAAVERFHPMELLHIDSMPQVNIINKHF